MRDGFDFDICGRLWELAGFLTLVFILLKVSGLVVWDWIWVFALAGITVVLTLGFLVFAILRYIILKIKDIL